VTESVSTRAKSDARYRLGAVLTGRTKPLRPHGEPSGIFKTVRAGPVSIEKTGILGDEQGDAKHHGGEQKAVHHYALDHYAAWRTELADRTDCFAMPGAFGENFSTVDMTEASVCVGDVYRVGTALLQVSQARQPCWKLNARFDTPDMASRVQDSARTGWYYRVLQPGAAQAGDELALLERPNPDWPLNKLLHYMYIETLNREALFQIAQMCFLTESWRRLATRRLDRRIVEDWSQRLSRPFERE
jgi:MOSC domain-containing protein YiiM